MPLNEIYKQRKQIIIYDIKILSHCNRNISCKQHWENWQVSFLCIISSWLKQFQGIKLTQKITKMQGRVQLKNQTDSLCSIREVLMSEIP
jgi:hypothetical protein